MQQACLREMDRAQVGDPINGAVVDAFVLYREARLAYHLAHDTPGAGLPPRRLRTMPEIVNADVAWALDDLARRLPALRRRRAYYEGHHRSAIPPGKTLSQTLRDLLVDLSDNLCDDVVDEPVSRLAITNWVGTADGQGQAAMDWWEANRGDARARETHRNAYMAGDGYVMIQKDKAGRSRMYVQQPEQMAVRYSTDLPDLVEVAAKVWRDGKRYRMNLYYARGSEGGARLERWATKGLGQDGGMPQARAFQPLVEADLAPVETDVDWAESDTLPIFHFPTDEVGRYGRSVLTDVIPLQDVLNKSVVDLVTAMEDVALPQRYATGVQVEIDPDTGQEKPLFRRSSTDQMLRTGSTEASFGQFDAANMTQFLEVQTAFRLRIAGKGYLPLHSVSLDATGNAPSGISLLVAEGRQIKRVHTGQNDWDDVWAAAAAYALTLDGIPTKPGDLDVEWAPAETRDERALTETLAMKVDLGLPKREALLELGYDEDDVDEWMDDAAAQAEAISGGRRSMAAGGLPTMAPPAPVGPAGAPAVAVPGV